jgi:Protein of unknown function (DUF2854)
MLLQIRWAVLLLSVGCVFAFVGGCYYLHEPVLWSAVALLTGVPMALVGLALKSTELAPVPIAAPAPTTIASLRAKATPTQTQILQEVTRYQYGSSVHLETALEKIGLSDEEDQHPVLLSIKEADVDGSYGLVLEFGALNIPYAIWQEKEDKMTRFFGPNVHVTTQEISQKKVAVTIAATTTATAKSISAAET